MLSDSLYFSVILASPPVHYSRYSIMYCTLINHTLDQVEHKNSIISKFMLF